MNASSCIILYLYTNIIDLMKRMTQWFKTWFTKCTCKKPLCAVTKPQNTSPNADFYANYFSLIAQGARLKLVEAMFSLNIFALFENQESVLERDIIKTLGLMPIRAQKWLHLLSCEYFLIKIELNGEPAYQLSDGFIKLIHSKLWWNMQFFFNSWSVSAEEHLSDVLRFGKVKTSISWPPKKDAEVAWLEYWMTETALQPIHCILDQIPFNRVASLLDVGGGDGTMACAFVAAHPHLKAAVYNLPKSAQMAREHIAAKNLVDRVRVIEGDFILEESFPPGHDLILFTRVLFDWNEQVSRKLLQMAYHALPKKGLVGICEFYKEENNDVCLSAEYRYIFHDDFSPNVMKTAAMYRQILKEIGFTVIQTKTEKEPLFAFCSLILAQK